MTTALFDSRAKEGAEAERRIFAIFGEAGWKVQWRMYRNRKDLEVGLPTGTEFIEVKCENYFATSPNLCIETFQGQPRRPAGIMTSESTIVVHTLGDECIAYRRMPMVNQLIEWEKSGAFRPSLFRNADNHNGGFIVPKISVVQYPWAVRVALEFLPLCKLFGAK